MTNSTTVQIVRMDEETFSARFDLPADGAPIATAILAHEFPALEKTGVDRILGRELNRHGIGVLHLAYSNAEDSLENTPGRSAESAVDDIRAAAETLASVSHAPDFFIGHSNVARSVLEAAAKMSTPVAVALVGAVLRNEAEADVRLSPRPLLVVHALNNKRGEFEASERFYQKANHPKSFLSLPGADHNLTDPVDAAYAGAILGQWARSSMPGLQEDVKHREKHDNCTVAVTRRDTYRTEILSNGHSLVADEPKELNGTNTGPTPYGLLLGSLAACTTITLRMYADRKDWPLESIHVRLTHERVHAEDCDCDAEDRTGLLDVIKKFVTLEGDLSDAQKTRLMQIADLCPVQRTIKNEPIITTVLQDEGAILECR